MLFHIMGLSPTLGSHGPGMPTKGIRGEDTPGAGLHVLHRPQLFSLVSSKVIMLTLAGFYFGCSSLHGAYTCYIVCVM